MIPGLIKSTPSFYQLPINALPTPYQLRTSFEKTGRNAEAGANLAGLREVVVQDMVKGDLQ